MKCNADRLVEALIAAELMEMQLQAAARAEKERKKAETYVVTVSRGYGSQGKEVAELLADTLEVRCCDRMILQQVAKRAQVDENLVRVLDEHVSKINGNWWRRLLNKEALSYDQYYENLVKTVLSISRTGGVILGRGAHMILGPERAFRVRVTGSLKKCAERVSRREGIDIQTATRLVREIDHEREEYIRILYGQDAEDPSMYDLVINSDRYNRVQIVDLILNAMEKSGYILPADARKSLQVLA